MEKAMKSALVIIGTGFEELEMVAPLDLLRRAEVDCLLASVESDLVVKGRNNIQVQADVFLSDVPTDKAFDLVLIPGGPGVAKLAENDAVIAWLQRQHQAQRLIAAICAAPMVLLAAGILSPEPNGVAHTAHFSVAETLPQLREDRAVVTDQHVVTSRGAGTAVQFGLVLVAALKDQTVAEKIAASIHHGIAD
jgi:4-methyl-5(b-hydroxyethyl)-thiazole monophosphate biosynthesis